jgi:phospholipase/carboxylesterase
VRELNSGRRGAAVRQAKYLIILVHGYGADGNDLLGLADPLGEHLPDAVFVAPDAPNKCSGNPFGFEWFPIPWMDGSSEEAAESGMVEAARDLNGFIDKTMSDEGVTPDKTILLGFSQGTMISLHIAPRRSVPFAGIVGFSGRLLEPDALAEETISRPPIMLVHGDQDPMVPIASLPEAAEALSAADFEVYTHISKGTAHGIAPDGLGVALHFMREKLGINT